ncbi:epoxide hydrolase [Punctularia strigosozonata HHB-11173 SS5]|uniref:epoxide hydrolase n=1 Tax=Punctularia strigosozonata (strain HHB-11173) TaxID=741275 RepID=UPI0004416B72|nr:epoxide hydrolase [Punctularia strigosozonata HHB-11173 SS5]EIN12328.1 epoxide hydrolase [Punctularia strigosozonata HHB-11173 SS5]
MASAERPFKVDIPDTQLEQLKTKLAFTRFPDELEDAGWDYGAPLGDVKRLVDRWRNEWDWRRLEAEINELPMFTQDIEIDGFDTLEIHYVHQMSESVNAIPLLFIHGYEWPGHFLEVRKILPLLSSQEEPSFHVVALGLPGYGWSEAPKKKGFRMGRYAEIANKLMTSLGYSEYVMQAGDLGHFVTRKMAILYGGKHLKAWHTNMPLGAPPTITSNLLAFLGSLLMGYSATDKAALARSQWFRTHGSGLLAWIYEKLHHWTDDYPWSDDEVLDWISVYWFSRGAPATTLKIYYELMQSPDFNDVSQVTTAPMGVSYFPKEVAPSPKSWVRLTGHVVFEAEHDDGGHFAAHKKPEELVWDLREMFGKGGPAFGVVSGKNGYKT